MYQLRKFNNWFNESDYPGSMRPYLWAAWCAWFDDMSGDCDG